MDWLSFFDDNMIDYVSRGPNTARGHVSVQCPYCGSDDPSKHLGIALEREAWGCLRNPQHRGLKPHRLIAALLGCSSAQARLVVAQYTHYDAGQLDDALATLEALNAPTVAPTTPTPPMPPQWRTIDRVGPTTKHWAYLAGRGFDDVGALVTRYGLKACLTGRWKDRVILPFYQDGALLGWTARALGAPVNAPRYLSNGESVKTTVFNEDEIRKGGELLFIVEGPFDALKMDFYGSALGARSTCVFGTSITMDQIYILNTACKRFKRVVVLFDHDAIGPSFYAADWLHLAQVEIGKLPEGVKDPGGLTKKQIGELINGFRDK